MTNTAAQMQLMMNQNQYLYNPFTSFAAPVMPDLSMMMSLI
jgi:hypothetical protein